MPVLRTDYRSNCLKSREVPGNGKAQDSGSSSGSKTRGTRGSQLKQIVLKKGTFTGEMWNLIFKKRQPAAVFTFANHGLKIPCEHQQTRTPHLSLSSEECYQTCNPSGERSNQRKQNSRKPRGQEGGLEIRQRFSTEKRFHQHFKSAFLIGNVQMLMKCEYFQRHLYSNSSLKIKFVSNFRSILHPELDETIVFMDTHLYIVRNSRRSFTRDGRSGSSTDLQWTSH